MKLMKKVLALTMAGVMALSVVPAITPAQVAEAAKTISSKNFTLTAGANTAVYSGGTDLFVVLDNCHSA